MERAIGVFDSGVGGLTVVAELMRQEPTEAIVYLGDTARVPYGTKSPETVIRYARACASILEAYGIKLLVIACNTASSYALEVLQEELDIPVIGVVEPGARAALALTENKRIGVIGTAGTVRSGLYEDVLRAIEPEATVFSRPCPLFVPLAEEGWTTGDVPKAVAQTYLETMVQHDIDTLVLGCTHYPLLKATIAEVVGSGVRLVDSAQATASVVRDLLSETQMLSTRQTDPKHRFLVSDSPEGFKTIGERFLGRGIEQVEWVDF